MGLFRLSFEKESNEGKSRKYFSCEDGGSGFRVCGVYTNCLSKGVEFWKDLRDRSKAVNWQFH